MAVVVIAWAKSIRARPRNRKARWSSAFGTSRTDERIALLLSATTTQGSSGVRKNAPSGTAAAQVTSAPASPIITATVWNWATSFRLSFRSAMMEVPIPPSVRTETKPR